jgi:RNA polymerase sigma-70 factor (ECF subfamily)
MGEARTPSADELVDQDDERLMRLFAAGSEVAFEVLFERHAKGVRALILRATGDRALANDITQATSLSVIGARARFAPGTRFKPWLYAIAMNALRDQRRRGRRELLSADGTLPEEVDEAVRSDFWLDQKLQGALRSLPEDQHEAIVLHQLAGFSFQEIAVMVGASESAAKVRAHRGYERLRTLTRTLWKGTV